nr:DUF421 domain-containing protein [Bacillus piscicola]
MIGEPLILIKNGKVIKSSLKRSRFSLAELLASIRAKGYADITHIQYAILEPSGDISVLIKEVSAPLTPASLGYQTNDQGLPIAVIIEGKIQPRNLQLIHKDKEWLRTKLQAVGVKSLDEIFYAAVREEDHSLIVDDGKGCF